MGTGDRLGDMADDAVQRTGGSDKAKEYLGKGSDAADRATGGKYREGLDKAETAGKSGIDKLGKRNKRK